MATSRRSRNCLHSPRPGYSLIYHKFTKWNKKVYLNMKIILKLNLKTYSLLRNSIAFGSKYAPASRIGLEVNSLNSLASMLVKMSLATSQTRCKLLSGSLGCSSIELRWIFTVSHSTNIWPEVRCSACVLFVKRNGLSSIVRSSITSNKI